MKKLAGMGVVSVTDLQNCDMDSLLSEFDETQSWKMKQLSRGIDESQVKLTGQPQVSGPHGMASDLAGHGVMLMPLM